MTIRPAGPADLDAIADLAQDQRLRQQGWQPDFWPLAPGARRTHPVDLASLLGEGCAHSVVVVEGDRLNGYALAVETVAAADGSATWVLEEFGVAKPKLWDTVGRVLLAVTAGAAWRRDVGRVVVPCPAGDQRRRAALVGARLDLNCWFRHRVLDAQAWPEAFVAIGDDEPGFPLPHLHGQMAATATSTSITAPGAHALLSPSLVPPSTVALGGTLALADPVIANDEHGLWLAVETLEETCRERGDVMLVIVAGAGEEPLDAMLDRRGYGRALEWWTLRPRP